MHTFIFGVDVLLCSTLDGKSGLYL